MKQKFLLAALMACSALAAQAVDLDKDSMIYQPVGQMKIAKTVSASRVSVHDPSIVVSSDGKTYYVFGSHRAAASSTDQRNWTWQNWNYGRVSTTGTVTSTTDFTGVFNTNQTKTVTVLADPTSSSTETKEVTFGNYVGEAWRYASTNASLGGNQWAPDVVWNPHMKKWCMYMSLNGDSWRSVIALLTSDKITGPYVYQGPVVFSGFQWSDPATQTYKQTDIELVLGPLSSLPSRYDRGSSWGTYWPNNIDPCVFFDEEGEMWMTYGSWSGGIFILRLNKENGLRDYTYTYPNENADHSNCTSDPYFGKKIGGGCYSSGEASYVEHIGSYYYLFITNGGLNSDGGYEMHYYRSKNPDGPYTDASGTNAIQSSYQMNYGPNAATTRGMKILGAYQWENMTNAELSQGHNSVLLDADGRAYIYYHTRFNDGSEGFQLRVHQLFLNEKGWLVAAPFEFNGLNGECSQYKQADIDSTELCTTNDIVGTYMLMLHPYKVDYANKAYSKPSQAIFKANGLISGDYYGTWKLTAGTSYIKIRMRPRSGSEYTEYYGVILPQVVSTSNMKSISFTAIASSGVSLWGCNLDGDYAISYTYQDGLVIPFTMRQIITDDIDLNQSTMHWGTSISWESSNPELLSNDGKLQVPYYANGDSTTLVGMTYTLSKDNYAYQFTRQVRVRTLKSLLLADEDVNADGNVDTQDVLKVYEYMKAGNSDTDATDQREDVNGDGKVDTQDVLKIYEYMKVH